MPASANGFVSRRSSHSVDVTIARLKSTLDAKGITLFAIVDHSGEAKKVGMEMRPTQLLIFGNPAAGTPVMLAAPSVAIDLPLKILVWEDSDGAVWLSWNDPEYLQQRHGLPMDLTKNLTAPTSLAAIAAE